VKVVLMREQAPKLLIVKKDDAAGLFSRNYSTKAPL
jgi:hypothetical protein